jgi:hypothetical protein
MIGLLGLTKHLAPTEILRRRHTRKKGTKKRTKQEDPSKQEGQEGQEEQREKSSRYQPLSTNSGTEEQTKKVYFYDDDTANNWSIKGRYNAGPFLTQEEKNEAEKKVKFIDIPVGTSGPVDKKYLSGGSDELNEIEYQKQEVSLDGGWYFPESGVKTGHLEQLTNDINENKVLAIVFDFDKTLQLFEGALVGSSHSLSECVDTLKKHNLAPKNWTSDDLATFILHDTTDPNRIDNLRSTLRFAEYKKIPIFIITNNNIPKHNQRGFLTDLFKFLGVTVEKDFILGGGTQYDTKYNVILKKVLPFAKGVEEEERKRATTGSSKTDSGETKSDEQSKKTSLKSKNVARKPRSYSFGGGKKKTKKHKGHKKKGKTKRKTKRKKGILKTRKKKKKSTKRK